jgi:hypothetical protein
MRVKVRFRFNAATGEVEAFEVDDMQDGPRLADHDARHDRAAAEVSRVVEVNALIEEAMPGAEQVIVSTTSAAAEATAPMREPERNRE